MWQFMLSIVLDMCMYTKSLKSGDDNSKFMRLFVLEKNKGAKTRKEEMEYYFIFCYVS